jgi:uncharacterized RDD family membrane protein YckC
MTGFCQDCGNPLSVDGSCPNQCGTDSPGRALAPGYGSGALPAVHDIGPLPKASTPRRLLGSGIEYSAYVCFAIVIMFLDTFSGGLLGFSSLLLLALIVVRDCNAGAFSIAKRVSCMRVVKRRTGQPASNAQALLRNSNYLALLAVETVLPWLAILWTLFFVMFVALDVAMILASPRGRRLGDLLAGTQVVEERS